MEGESQTPQSIKAELSIFDDHSFQVTHLKGQWAEILPENLYQGTNQTSIMIKISQAEGWYMDFNDAYILLDASIVKEDGTKIGAAEEVAFVNYAAAALFKDMKLVGGAQKIEVENQSYAYKAYLYSLLSSGISAKKYQLTASGFERDEPVKFDDRANKAYVVRKGWTSDGKSKQFIVPVLLDSWMQAR